MGLLTPEANLTGLPSSVFLLLLLRQTLHYSAVPRVTFAHFPLHYASPLLLSCFITHPLHVSPLSFSRSITQLSYVSPLSISSCITHLSLLFISRFMTHLSPLSFSRFMTHLSPLSFSRFSPL